MNIQLDTESGVPLYLQIVRQIEYMILSGILKPGDFLPSIKDLAVELHIHPKIVYHTYKELSKEKILTFSERAFVIPADAIAVIAEKKPEILAELLDTAIKRAFSLGFTREEIVSVFNYRLHRNRKNEN